MANLASGAGIRLRAPAKINLFLHITGRRPDGYHTLQTAFQFLDICDALQFRQRPDGQRKVRLSGLADIKAEENLIVRAARLLQDYTACDHSVDIEIDKQLPIGGGIGGGSSDAASTLLALNHLWGLDLSAKTLQSLGLRLGADVPVFIAGHAAFAEGVGEQLQAIQPNESWALLLAPECEVSTAQIFAHPQLTRDTRPIKIAAFLSGACPTSNDCLPVVQSLHPEVGRAMDWLGQFARPQLTGTGACMFAKFDHEADVRRLVQQVPPPWRAWAAKTCNVSPALLDLEALTQGM